MTARETADSLAEMTGAFERRRDAIEAALLAERKAALAGVRVKPLVWEKPPLADTLTKAETIVGAYAVWTHPEAGGRWFATLRGANNYLSYEASDEASCRAAAQADYESRIRSALESGEDRYAEGRKAALAEAAAKAKAVGDDWAEDDGLFEMDWPDAAYVIATAILSLSPEGKGPDDGWVSAWMREAMAETVVLARSRRMDECGASPDGLSFEHIKLMPERATEDFSAAKLGRWLGWMQAAVVAANCGTLDEMKMLNKRCSRKHRPLPPTDHTPEEET